MHIAEERVDLPVGKRIVTEKIARFSRKAEETPSNGEREINILTKGALQYDVRKMPNCSQYDLFGRVPNRSLEYGEKYREPVWLVEAEFDCKSEHRPLAVALILNNWQKFKRRQLVRVSFRLT